MSVAKKLTNSLNSEEPVYFLYKHNLDEEFSKYINQLYPKLTTFQREYDKYFYKLNERKEKNVFEEFDIDSFIESLNQNILKNDVYFDSATYPKTLEVFQQVSNYIKKLNSTFDENYKNVENISTSYVFFTKIEPFRNELYESFISVERNLNIDDHSIKLNDLFEKSFTLLKQYKKSIYKLKDFELQFPFSQSNFESNLSNLHFETLDIQDVKRNYELIKLKMKSLLENNKKLSNVDFSKPTKEIVT